MGKKRKLKPDDVIKKGDYYKNGDEYHIVLGAWTGLKPKNFNSLDFYREKKKK